MIHSWYLSTLFQLHLFGGLALYLIEKRPRTAILVFALVYTLSVYINVADTLDHDYDPIAAGWDRHQTTKMLKIFYKIWFHLGPYLIGLLLGYALHLNQEIVLKFFIQNRRILTLLATLMILAPLYSLNILHKITTHRAVWAAVFANERTVIALGFAGIFLLCLSNPTCHLASFLSHPALTLLKQLNYNFYLLHWPLCAAYIGTARFPIYFSFTFIIGAHLLISFSSLALAVLFKIVLTDPVEILLRKVIFMRVR